ncbi:hypothetical protein [Serratia plymuthica]|uniref:hypothetical protein n=1 Tax=Serratia plymuthica TaxID=82996 RepID=UPI00093625A7|nr:hypothetical protein [Serratia plymuthica]OJT41528.1 hypothetical protein BSR04_11355 [Serratia plymuthica]
MGSISQNLKASISFGGNIDASWGRSTEGLNKGIKAVEKQSEKLTKQQRDLADQMKKTKLAGKDISGLKKDYAGVTREIKKAEAAQEALNRDLQKAERLKRFGSMGRGTFGKALNIARQSFPGGMALGGGGLAAAAIGATLSPVALNSKTAEKAGMARNYGVGIETYNAWDGMAKQMGMNGENIGDLAEELKNKVGEYKALGKMGALEDAFSMMGFGSKSLKGLNNEQQMSKIFERALKMQDEQKAASAVDMLMGGEANKILTYMRATGKSYQQLMEEQKRYNVVTQQGADGALKGNIAFSNLQTVLTSGAEEIAGALGNELAPEVTKVANDLSGWLKNGGVTKISNALQNEWYPKLIGFGQGLIYVGKIAYALAQKLSWLLPDEKDNKKSVLRSMGMTGSTEVARDTAKGKGLETWFDEQLEQNPELLKEVRTAYIKSNGMFSFDDEEFEKRLDKYVGPSEGGGDPLKDLKELGANPPPMPGATVSAQSQNGTWPTLTDVLSKADTAPQHKPEVNDNRRQQMTVNVYASENHDPKQVAEEAIGNARRNDIFNGNNSLYDIPEAG